MGTSRFSYTTFGTFLYDADEDENFINIGKRIEDIGNNSVFENRIYTHVLCVCVCVCIIQVYYRKEKVINIKKTKVQNNVKSFVDLVSVIFYKNSTRSKIHTTTENQIL